MYFSPEAKVQKNITALQSKFDLGLIYTDSNVDAGAEVKKHT